MSEGPVDQQSGILSLNSCSTTKGLWSSYLTFLGLTFLFLKNEWVGFKIFSISKILLFYMVTHSTKASFVTRISLWFPSSSFHSALFECYAKYEQESNNILPQPTNCPSTARPLEVRPPIGLSKSRGNSMTNLWAGRLPFKGTEMVVGSQHSWLVHF